MLICCLTKYPTTTSAICNLTNYLQPKKVPDHHQCYLRPNQVPDHHQAICDLTKYLTTTSAIYSTKYQFPILCKHTVKYEDLTLLDDQVGDKAQSPYLD